MGRTALTIALVLVLCSSAISSEEQGREMTWEGYLWRDHEGRVQLGWPVIAMGVMAAPMHIVEGDLAKRLGPLVSEIGDSHFFWNFSINVPAEKSLPEYPRALVRIRGLVVREAGAEGNIPRHSGAHHLRDGRLLSVEWIREDWLRAWAPWFTDQPSSVKIMPGQKEIGFEREFAPKAVAALRAMRKVVGPTDAEQSKVSEIEPEARVVEDFRRAQEAVVLRWLIQENKELSLGLENLEKEFGRPPPSSISVQRWFLAAKTKQAFLEKVRKEWNGRLDDLTLPYYVEEGGGTSYAVVRVLTVEKEWSEKDYAAHLSVSKGILAR